MPINVDANIVSNSELAATKSRELTSKANQEALPINLVDFSTDPNIDRPPDYLIYLYNVAALSHQIARPPLMPVVNIPACPVDKPYLLFGTLPNVINQKTVDAYTGSLHNVGYRGEMVANDIINPSNIGMAQFVEVRDWSSIGTDLTVQGCFWSRHNPPLDTELQTARTRLEKRFQALIEEANSLVSVGRQNDLSGDHHAAANYFRLQTSWHRSYEAPSQCPSCGEEIKAGVAFHRNSIGSICVLDWQRTVDVGVKTLAEVPTNKRWSGPKWANQM
ncbi:MAG: hypothetical protein ACRD22_03340 [Terriglobia bacterium]